MAFYKVIKNGSVIDVLDHITYVKWNQRHMKPYLSTETEAEGFLSQNHKKVYAVYGMRQNPQHVFDHVDDLVEITELEYHQLNALNMKTPQEIIDEYTLVLLEGGVI